MILTTQEERRWFVRNLAQGIVSYMGVTVPPVWIENLMRYPPAIRPLNPNNEFDLWDEINARLIDVGGKFIMPSALPDDERRYALAREVIIAIGGSKHGRAMGLPKFIVPYLTELQDYFARVLLAPDPLIIAYRKGGGEFSNFAKTFLIPHRIAEIRWEESAHDDFET
ncbi:MAG: hypothetical protein GTO18_21255 [Anaerolineales bacterium]|nr:hypothetical protein [Anaerolineales bacterium]